jgi:hypothetical protein
MDPDVPIAELSTLASYVSNAMSQTRFLLALIGAFAALALGLGARPLRRDLVFGEAADA